MFILYSSFLHSKFYDKNSQIECITRPTREYTAGTDLCVPSP